MCIRDRYYPVQRRKEKRGSPLPAEKVVSADGELLWAAQKIPGSVPCGTAVDFPRYQLRGFMLDVARTPYPLSYLKDVIRTCLLYTSRCV